MPAPVSVIIPSLNEERYIAATVDSAIAAGASEVLVADGGSTDRTIEIAEAHGACVVLGQRMRARQMNRGAEAATQPFLVFLHADTRLPANAAGSVVRALNNGFAFGGFRVRFEERGMRLRAAAALINARTMVSRCPWGDQAQFIRRDRFLRDGGYREIPIMEDYELAIRMKKSARSVLLRERVTTSGRRFLEKGLIRTAAINWRIVIAWRLGEDPEKLAEIYRK